ncbi:MAG: DNA polymerase III subunit gamma/tau [Clostridia bacterium]|nr:DNA polymerase III subunit gamma/tau [Clostridia bacterium]
MAYTALYRKYRPTTFSQVAGQEHITKTLMSELSSGKIFHAYLFTGTRGTGKTTCAKILAKAVNCLNLKNGDPCGDCAACKAIESGEVMDITEIDAASNNGVENIRTLREQLQFTPASGKYRVYIIDEVHMLSIGAFNALLKTLEEPPKHVVFVLATTEVHKLPATILSRCQRFDFKRIEPLVITERIKLIAQKEGFTITDNAAFMIASVADGGMRDALSVLDLCVSASTNITEDTVAEVCGMAGDEYLFNFAQIIKNKDSAAAIKLANELYVNSVDMLRLAQDLTQHFRDLLIIKTIKNNPPIVCSSNKLKKLEEQALNFEITEIMRVMRLLGDSLAKMQSTNRRAEMEVTLIKLCTPNICSDLDSLLSRVTALENGVKPEPKAEVKAVSSKPEPVKAEEKEIKEPEPTKPQGQNLQNGKLDPKIWKEILAELAKTVPLISGILKGSSAYIDGQFLLIETQNSQFAELMNGKNNLYREKLKKAIFNITGNNYNLGPYRKAQQTDNADPLESLKNKLKELEVPGL